MPYPVDGTADVKIGDEWREVIFVLVEDGSVQWTFKEDE